MADDMTEILAKLDAQTKEIENLKASIDAKDNEIKNLTQTINEKEVNIGKLQKIVSDNLIASRDEPKGGINAPKDFNEIYANAIKENMKENK